MMHGSFSNRMMDGNQYGELRVGMGATELSYSDREAYTVQRVVSENRVIVTRDKVKRIDSNGPSDVQEYEFENTPLVEGKREKACTNWFITQFTFDGRKTEDEVCKFHSEHGTCEGCPFWKFHKPSNGVVVIKTKDGWKRMGGNTYFALGVRDEFYDYSF